MKLALVKRCFYVDLPSINMLKSNLFILICVLTSAKVFPQQLMPFNLVGTSGNTCASLSFEVHDVAYFDNSYSYQVEVQPGSLLITTGQSPAYITGLSNGVVYTLRVRTLLNETPISGWSTDLATVKPSSIAPDATFNYNNLKSIAIEVAQSRSNLAQAAGYLEEATLLNSQSAQLQAVVLPVPATPFFGVGFFPKTKITNDSNPYKDALNKWAASYLNNPAPSFAKATPGNSVIGVFTVDQIRIIGYDLIRLYWLLVSPESDYRYHPELFRRYLTLIYALSDDYDVNGGDAQTGNISQILGMDDWFAQIGISYGWFKGLFSFDSYIPPLLKTRIDSMLVKMGLDAFSKSQTLVTTGAYVNKDISYGETLLHCGLSTRNQAWLNYSRVIVDSIYMNEVYPDGAFSYIWNHNEVANYHTGSVESMARIYSNSAYQPALQTLYLLPKYDLISSEPGFVAEFYTASAWKHQWNNARVFSGDFLGYLTENPYYQTLLQQRILARGYGPDLLNYTYFKPGISSKPIPNNYLIYDRNIQGPRYRKDDFSYGITLREVHEQGGIGHKTLAGMMVTEPAQGQFRDPHSALTAAYAKVHTESGTLNEWSNWAYLINIQNQRVAMSKTIGSASTLSTLSRQTSGPTGHPRNWGSFQEWLTLPDRMIGLIEVYPTVDNTQAFEVDFRFRFTSGRTAVTNLQTLITTIPNELFTYGKLELRVIEHNNESIFTASSGVNRDDGPGSEVVFRNGSFNNGVRTSYPLNYRRFALVELRKQGVLPNYTITRFDSEGVKAIIATSVDKVFSVWRNTTGSNVTVDISSAMIPGASSFLHYSRGDSQTQAPMELTQSSITLEANQHVLIITSNNSEEVDASWENYDVLQENLPALSISSSDMDAIISQGQMINFEANVANIGTNTNYQWKVNDINVGNGGMIFSSNTLQNDAQVSCVLTTTLPNGSVYQVESNIIVVRISTSPPITFDQAFLDGKNIASINTIEPHRSAVFQIESRDKGVLIPRLSGDVVEAIQTPSEGLLVYALSTGSNSVDKLGFWFFKSGNWQYLDPNTDLYDVSNTILGNRTVSLDTNKLIIESNSTKMSVNAGFTTKRAIYGSFFRTIFNNLMTWLPDDIGVVLNNGYTGTIVLPNAIANVNRVVGIKNVSGSSLSFENNTGSPTGLYTSENVTFLLNNSTSWFVSDGVSWRVYK